MMSDISLVSADHEPYYVSAPARDAIVRSAGLRVFELGSIASLILLVFDFFSGNDHQWLMILMTYIYSTLFVVLESYRSKEYRSLIKAGATLHELRYLRQRPHLLLMESLVSSASELSMLWKNANRSLRDRVISAPSYSCLAEELKEKLRGVLTADNRTFYFRLRDFSLILAQMPDSFVVVTLGGDRKVWRLYEAILNLAESNPQFSSDELDEVSEQARKCLKKKEARDPMLELRRLIEALLDC